MALLFKIININLLQYFLLAVVIFTSAICSPSQPLTSSANERTLVTISNPNCGDYQSCLKLTPKPDLVYTHSTDNDTSIHFISSTLGGFPGFFITRTATPTILQINWDSLLNNCSDSFNLPSIPDDSIGVLLLSFFNIDHKDIHWTLDKNGSINCDSSTCKFGYTSSEQSSLNETISISLEMKNKQSSFEDLPHLLFSPSSMHIDLQITNLDKSQMNKSDGIKLLVFSSFNEYKETLERTIDDENSPGVFTKRTFLFSQDNENNTNFLQWKPVAYNSKERVMSKTMEINSSHLTDAELPRLNYPLYCFHKQFYSNYSVHKFNASFVQEGKSSATKIDLITWSLIFGLDQPPKEKLSTFLQLMLFVGVGMSFVVMFVSLIYVVAKKWQKSRATNEPTLINEDILDY